MHSFCLEGNTFQWGTASRLKKSSSSCCRIAPQSLSTVNIPVSCLSSRVLEYRKGNIAVHHKKRRRVNSVVTTEAFRPRIPEEFFKRQSFQRKFLGENKKVLPEKLFDHVFIAIRHVYPNLEYYSRKRKQLLAVAFCSLWTFLIQLELSVTRHYLCCMTNRILQKQFGTCHTRNKHSSVLRGSETENEVREINRFLKISSQPGGTLVTTSTDGGLL